MVVLVWCSDGASLLPEKKVYINLEEASTAVYFLLVAMVLFQLEIENNW